MWVDIAAIITYIKLSQSIKGFRNSHTYNFPLSIGLAGRPNVLHCGSLTVLFQIFV